MQNSASHCHFTGNDPERGPAVHAGEYLAFGSMSKTPRPYVCCSGPVRYDCVDGDWVYKRDGHEMLERLQSELDAISRQINGDE